MHLEIATALTCFSFVEACAAVDEVSTPKQDIGDGRATRSPVKSANSLN